MKKLIFLALVLTLVSCEKDEPIQPEPKVNFTDWANFGNTTFQVDTTFINQDTI